MFHSRNIYSSEYEYNGDNVGFKYFGSSAAFQQK